MSPPTPSNPGPVGPAHCSHQRVSRTSACAWPQAPWVKPQPLALLYKMERDKVAYLLFSCSCFALTTIGFNRMAD
jgi:hypothetical protein